MENPTVYNETLAYGNSKLANAIYGKQLARRLKEDSVTVVIYDPGLIGNTGIEIFRRLGWMKPFFNL
jgi:NAD(P)-dependent dehydrogenase (short-subunit alcohol dehydrogenase family)